jgi:hypothetical protein
MERKLSWSSWEFMMRRWTAIVVALCLLLVVSVGAQQSQPAPASQSQAAPAKPSAPQAPASLQGNPDTQVWVNTNTGVYHCPGTRWYGATKSGQYMKQSDAQQKGFRPAYHRPCK